MLVVEIEIDGQRRRFQCADIRQNGMLEHHVLFIDAAIPPDRVPAGFTPDSWSRPKRDVIEVMEVSPAATPEDKVLKLQPAAGESAPTPEPAAKRKK